MKIIVTGHEGYIGPVFARHVAKYCQDWKLIGIDTGFFREQLTGPDPAHFFAKEIRADIRDIPATILEACDAVVHLAAVSNDPMGKEFEEATHNINTTATIRLAKMCREAGVSRFIFASSCSMYGAGSDVPRKEDDKLNPLTAYALAKVAAEKELLALADDDFQITCLRFATACGASPRLRLDLVMNDFVTSAILVEKIEVLSDGTPWRPLIHTEDMARAIEWALQRDGIPFLAVNIGSNAWTWQIGGLAHDVADVLGNVEVSINTAAQSDKRSYKVDFSLFEQLAPNHQPQKTFEEAVLELRKQIKNIQFDRLPFRQSQFIRLNVLRRLKKEGSLSTDLRWN